MKNTNLRNEPTTIKTAPASAPGFWKKTMSRFIGMLAITFSLVVFVQVMPLLFVFTGGFLGIAADASINNVDGVVWIFTNLSILVPVVYLFVMWVKYLCARFVVQPGTQPLFPFLSVVKKHS